MSRPSVDRLAIKITRSYVSLFAVNHARFTHCITAIVIITRKWHGKWPEIYNAHDNSPSVIISVCITYLHAAYSNQLSICASTINPNQLSPINSQITHLECPENGKPDDVSRVVLELFVTTNLDYAIQEVAGKSRSPQAHEHRHHQLAAIKRLEKVEKK
jgi:hypothetical protein